MVYVRKSVTVSAEQDEWLRSHDPPVNLSRMVQRVIESRMAAEREQRRRAWKRRES